MNKNLKLLIQSKTKVWDRLSSQCHQNLYDLYVDLIWGRM